MTSISSMPSKLLRPALHCPTVKSRQDALVAVASELPDITVSIYKSAWYNLSTLTGPDYPWLVLSGNIAQADWKCCAQCTSCNSLRHFIAYAKRYLVTPKRDKA